MNFGKVVRKLREYSQKNQRNFADYIGISQTSLSFIESGKTIPTNATLDRIARRFKTRRALLVMAAFEVDKELSASKKNQFNNLLPNFEREIWSLIFNSK
ncbi:helix-turn-helix domain-containing protein [Chitinophaga eiseniae]|uniref:Helix-turn-helix transcriptional regulator n=1 Tax=Chitinophaga eiseniae TaxID=634771 RepID=A0A847SKX6_9BACT|nr:helix-turn-helix transcriptional regulator [Chitinophaga eiseniae]NLR78046.1 helix-turn-helix transcriptional regulator [Chitinophaga eiseniae]